MVPLLYVVHPHLHGWRWAIYLASREQFDAEPLRRCVNAGFDEDRARADLAGQTVLYSLMNFAQMVRRRVVVTPLELDSDPVPAVPLAAVDVSDGIVQIGEA